jgi:hypothetical protein
MVVGVWLQIPNGVSAAFYIITEIQYESQCKVNDYRRANSKESTVDKEQSDFTRRHHELLAQVTANPKKLGLNK